MRLFIYIGIPVAIVVMAFFLVFTAYTSIVGG